MRAIEVRPWIWPSLVGLIAIIGVAHYQLTLTPFEASNDNGLRQIDLLYLNETAPSLIGGPKATGKRVVVFCEACRLPVIAGVTVISTKNVHDAQDYALLTDSGLPGPGYIIVDSHDRVRYRTYDSHLSDHAGEISRLVRAIR